MSEKLIINKNDTQKRLALNGDESNIFVFDPGDLNTRKEFYEASRKIKIKERELDVKAKKINPNNVEASLKLEEETFDYVANLIDKVFGIGTSKKVCGKRKNLVVLANFLIALTPYFAEYNKKAAEKYTDNLKNAGVL